MHALPHALRRLLPLLLGIGLTASAAPPPLPKDVAAFMERRDACDHWRGEAGYDAERRKDIEWSICQSCPGTDAELAKLKGKYAGNKAVMDKLSGYETEVEPKDKAAAAKACSAARKPAWLR